MKKCNFVALAILFLVVFSIPLPVNSEGVETTYTEHSSGLKFISRHGSGVSMYIKTWNTGKIETAIIHEMKNLVTTEECGSSVLIVLKSFDKAADYRYSSEYDESTIRATLQQDNTSLNFHIRCKKNREKKILDFRITFENPNELIYKQKNAIELMLKMLDILVKYKIISPS